MKSLAFLAAAAILITGCATPNVANNVDPSSSKNTGVVAGSITYEGIYQR
jgi:uncharacterized lipoprotein YajG